MLPLSLVLFCSASAQPSGEPLDLSDVGLHLKLGLGFGNDTGDGGQLEGVLYLRKAEGRCHHAFLAILNGGDRETQSLREECIDNMLDALAGQTCDRSRFLPAVERYAFQSRQESKLSDRGHSAAVRTLGDIGSHKHIEGLLKLSPVGDRRFRKDVLVAIGKLGDRRHAADVLGLIGTIPADEHPIHALNEKTRIEETAKALAKKPEPAAANKK